MASKTRAKRLMGIDPLTEVTEADLPVLVKAAAGGGGRGMRIVRRLADLEAEKAAARAEARAAFGEDEVFVEPYLASGRHVEVQILADTHGTVWTLGTRDCSLQRRHQKVVEEAPAPGLTEDLTEELYALAERAARAVGYTGAGTVEFLVADGRAHFLEMNTRLQVEHPVTEAVFGLDLVALQLRIAEGRALDRFPPRPRGHAVEARLYAEDPARDWAPATGTLHRLAVPDGVRLDTGYADGDEIGVHYDALLAKVVAHGETRAEAVRRLAGALERAEVHGPVTNRELLVRSLRHEEFAEARMDTGFYERHAAALTVPAPDPWAPLAAALAEAPAAPGSAAPGATCPRTPRSSGTARRARSTRSATGTAATGWPWRAARPAGPARCGSSGSPRTRWFWRWTGSGAPTPSPGTGRTASTSATRSCTPCPGSPRPPSSASPAPCSPRCPARWPGSRRACARGRGWWRGSRCCGWRR